MIPIENSRRLPSLPLAFWIARFSDLPLDKMPDLDGGKTRTTRAGRRYGVAVLTVTRRRR